MNLKALLLCAAAALAAQAPALELEVDFSLRASILTNAAVDMDQTQSLPSRPEWREGNPLWRGLVDSGRTTEFGILYTAVWLATLEGTRKIREPGLRRAAEIGMLLYIGGVVEHNRKNLGRGGPVLVLSFRV